MITADYHLHTNFSADSAVSMEDMVKQAISIGLTQICFTDHIDYDYPTEYGILFEFDVDTYFHTIEELSLKYNDKIQIRKGIELGLKPSAAQKSADLIKKYPFDFVICSSHLVENKDPYYHDYWEDKTQEEGIRNYFQTIADNIFAFTDFDAYGHLDYIIRYTKDKGVTFSYADYADCIDAALRAIISAGKALEVNSAGYKYGLHAPNPNFDIIKRYKELGGSFITIGSDAHKPEHIGTYFSEVKQLLLSLGFKQYVIFEQRKPIYYLL